MEGGLTFTIGKGFGQMLQRIAWEKLTEKYNPREAVEIITKSLLGCTEGMAVDILDGKIILGEDEATQEVTGTPGAGGKFNDWIREQRIHLEEEAKEWVKSLEGIRQEIADAGGKFEFSVRYPELISYLSGDKDAGLLDYPRSNVVEEIKGTVEGAKNFFVKVSEVYEVIVWMCDALNTSRVLFSDSVLRVRAILDSLACSDPEVEASIRKQDFQKQRLSEFMENEMKIEEYHKTELEPVEITEGYDAGWLSPDGDFYGLNGSTENLLHLNIAERLLASKKDSSQRDAESGSLAGRERLGEGTPRLDSVLGIVLRKNSHRSPDRKAISLWTSMSSGRITSRNSTNTNNRGTVPRN